jgi:hypothetical protein
MLFGCTTPQEYIAKQLETLIWWRSRVAARNPDDDLNPAAVAHAQRLLEQLPQANERWLEQLAHLGSKLWFADDTRVIEEEFDFWRGVGRHNVYETIGELIRDLIDLFQGWLDAEQQILECARRAWVDNDERARQRRLRALAKLLSEWGYIEQPDGSWRRREDNPPG